MLAAGRGATWWSEQMQRAGRQGARLQQHMIDTSF